MALLVRFVHDGTVYTGTLQGQEVVSDGGRRFPRSQVRLLTPTQPTKVICVGFNYRDHASELRWEVPQEPLFFLKPPSALVADGEPIEYPPFTRQLEYEGELAVVIGRRCRCVSREEAPSVILGYSIVNDVTARDVQRMEKQWVRAKAFDTSAPYGPVVATGLDPSNLRIVTRVNGQVRQDSSTRHLIFDVFDLVAAASQVMTLEVGDVIATGTPPGVGALQVGDEVSVEIEGIGVLTNRVVQGFGPVR
ncbi:MAG TPA: fumarylacetoacetate hydrolase family protein [Limnochordales bacterium]